MTRQNRVTPLGDLVADPARGLIYGNRGCLHDAEGRIRRRHNGKRWIACRLEFRGWQRGPLMQPGRFTELFFLDEATAFAAGHRPCALCRRADYVRFGEIWTELHPGAAGADEVDAHLHTERLAEDGAKRRLHIAEAATLPDGAFVLHRNAPHLAFGQRLLRWTPAGYAKGERRPHGRVTLITPPTLVAVLHAGWEPEVPLFHPSVRRARRRGERAPDAAT